MKVAGDGTYTQRVTITRAVHERNHASMTGGAMVAMVALTVLGAAACGSSSRSTWTTPSLHGHVLAEEATTGDTFTDNFNPFDAASTAHAMDVTSLMYEPLFEFNALNPAQIHPWLATAYGFNSAGTQLTITVKSNVKFSDGTAMTANDVAFTFDTIYTDPKADYSDVAAQTAAATVSGDNVTLTFATAQFTSLYSILGNTFIVPKSKWSSVADEDAATISDPVGTGPFVLSSFSTQVIKFTRNTDYWGSTPTESEVDIPYYATDADASAALVAGALDWAGNDITNVDQNYVDLNPSTNHAWFASGNTVSLEFNVNSAAAPALADPQVRLAISAGIDRTALADLGGSGYESPATSSSGLILPNQSAYLTASQVNDLKPGSDAAAVESFLTADGYTAPSGSGTCTSDRGATPPVPANCYTKLGTAIVFAIEDPVPYAAYWEDAGLIVSELNSESIAAWAKGDNPDTGWYADYQSGNFQCMVHWGQGGSTPYVQLQNWLDSSQPRSVGDYGGFTSSAATAALTTLAVTNPSNTAAVTMAVQTLTDIISTQAPVVPLLYGADWNVYSSAHFTGWPDGANPYMDPSPADPQLPYILMQLKAVS